MSAAHDRTRPRAQPGESERSAPRKRFHGRPLTLISIVMIIAAWELTALLAGKSPYTGATVIPTIEETFGAFKSFANYWKGGLGAGDTRLGAPVTYWGAVLGLIYNLYFTIGRLVAGLALGMAFGIGLAFLFSWSRLFRETISFPAHFLRMMPLLAMVPLFGLWFRDKDVGAIVFIAVAVFVLLFVITINAIGNIPGYYAQFARSLGASPVRVYVKVVFPAVLPELRGGILLSLGFSWNAVLAAEFLGQQHGLGRIVMFAQEFGKTETIALAAIIGIVLASITFLLVNRLFSWLVRWAE